MTGIVDVWLNGVPRRVEQGVTVAAVLFQHGIAAFRRDTSGAARAALCGMGSCMECRVTIDEVAGRRACLVVVRDGMRIEAGQ